MDVSTLDRIIVAACHSGQVVNVENDDIGSESNDDDDVDQGRWREFIVDAPK